MDNVGRLALFRDVVERGGFSQAATYRGIAHSTVSKQVKSLEQELGVVLLRRNSRSMRLTEPGQVAYEHSRRISEVLNEMLVRLQSPDDRILDELHVASPRHLTMSLVQPAINALLAERPELRVRLSIDESPELSDHISFDVAIREGLNASRALSAVELIDTRPFLVASPALLRRLGEPHTIAELTRFPTVARQSGESVDRYWVYLDGEQHRTLKTHPVLISDEPNLLLEAVVAGVGVGRLPLHAVHRELENRRLVPVLSDIAMPVTPAVYVYSRSAKNPPPKIAAFQRHLLATADGIRETLYGQS